LFQHLYPDEDLRLMRCAAIDYAVRALFGLCNREGGRLGEFLALKWSGVDPKRGTITLGIRKGGKPGTWKAEPGSLEALEPLRALGGEGPFSHLPDDGQWSERLQEAMRTAGLDREALYYSNVAEGFRRMRGHDTRATYITLALAAGLSESHIMARTGHTTSKMVHRYDHAAEALAASDGGCRLMPLDFALGLYAHGAPLPPPRRAGWMTLDPSSPEAADLARRALPASPVPLLGPGDDDPSGSRSASSELTRPEAVDGELVDEGDDCKGEGPVDGLTPKAAQAVTSRVTNSLIHGVGEEAYGKECSMFSAVAPAGFEPAQPCGRGILSSSGACTSTQLDELTTRNPVAGIDGPAHEVSPEAARVRPPEAPVSTAPAAPDPVLASLQAAAHAAIDSGDGILIGELARLIERHRRAAAPPEAPSSTAGARGGA
jgi:hypothetical protein